MSSVQTSLLSGWACPPASQILSLNTNAECSWRSFQTISDFSCCQFLPSCEYQASFLFFAGLFDQPPITQIGFDIPPMKTTNVRAREHWLFPASSVFHLQNSRHHWSHDILVYNYHHRKHKFFHSTRRPDDKPEETNRHLLSPASSLSHQKNTRHHSSGFFITKVIVFAPSQQPHFPLEFNKSRRQTRSPASLFCD